MYSQVDNRVFIVSLGSYMKWLGKFAVSHSLSGHGIYDTRSVFMFYSALILAGNGQSGFEHPVARDHRVKRYWL